MKKISKIIATLLGVLTFSTTVTACTDNGKNSSAGKVTPIGTGDYVNYDDLEVDDVANIHERSISTTSHKLVTAGASEYVIVKDENTSMDMERAVNEFYVLFQEATGIKLPIVTDTGLTYSDNAKYISFGKTNVLESSSINVDYATLGSQGYELITKGASLFVAGEDLGVLWGAYDLLDVLFDFTMYTDVYYTLNKNVKDLALPALDVKEVPDILYRKAPNGTIKDEALQRMRYNDADPIFSHGGGVHTWYSFISPEEYWEDHPSWFTLSKNQLCLTAGEYGGEEYQLLLEETVKKVKEVIDKEQEKNWLRFTQMDIVEWCNCDGCKEIIQRYGGANSATQILFVNDLAERIEAWLQSDEAGRNKGRDIQIVMFAYHMTEEAPTHKDANGEYVLNAPEMRLRDNVTVNIAHLFTNYTESLLDPVQKNTYELIKGWEPVSDNYICWAYDVYFGHYQMPRDTYNAMQSWVKTLYNMGAQWYWPQGNYQNPKSTAFDSVKSFIYSKYTFVFNASSIIFALVALVASGIFCTSQRRSKAETSGS